MSNINKIIFLLTAISNFAKDIHYNCKGDAFYSKHILCDRISENIYGYIDSIKEVYFLARLEEPLLSKEYLKNAISYIPEISNFDSDNFTALANLITATLKEIQQLTELTIAEENLFGNIAENLQGSLGLINRQVI